jgi:murein DD-endopeptidase MepM/ murein hydrolase activator NlpD
MILLLGLCGAVAVAATVRMRASAEAQFASEVRAAQEVAANMPQPDVISEVTIQPGITFSEMLVRMGMDTAAAENLIAVARPVFNFRRLRQGNKLVLARTAEGEIRSLRYNIDADHDLWIARVGEDFRAEVKEIPSTEETVGLRGELKSSLFESVLEMGETPELAIRLAEIFAWDLDFYTDPQPGDTFRLVVEKKQYASGAAATYGRILAAEYVNAGRPYRAVLFREPNGRAAYYSDDGKSLQKAFLRSPLKFAARVSSRFTHRRFHPVLKRYRPHLGTDYAAPTGTPVQSIADGRVVWAGRKGGGGITVEIAHVRGYHSYYLHLSRALVRRGQSVRQGQTIGRVGATGLATGPHLDFRIRRNGAFVNFERIQLPPAQPVAKRDFPEFAAERDRWMAMLPGALDGTAVAEAKPDTTGTGAAGSR